MGNYSQLIHILRENMFKNGIIHILREKCARWEVNAQSSILYNETLDVKPLKKAQSFDICLGIREKLFTFFIIFFFFFFNVVMFSCTPIEKNF